MSFARLQNKIFELENPTVVGIDPALGNIPTQILDKHIAEHGETLDAAGLAVIEYSVNLIDGLCEIVPAVKPQCAFFEALGSRGFSALKLICDFAKSKGMYVIMDGKRNDIGTTAEAYSDAFLGKIKIGETEVAPFDADALTVNAYLGSDGIRPFLEAAVRYDKAVFALIKTSNPSSGELQDMILQDSGETVYTAVGDLMEKISGDAVDEGGFSRIGAVVGATYQKEMAFLRDRLSKTFFLVPGYGAQGGTVEDVAPAFNKNGSGAIVNSSRTIIAAWKKSRSPHMESVHYVDAAREEAVKMRDALRTVCGF